MSARDKECTKDNPMPADANKHEWYHPDAKITGECYQGCCDDYTCPHCGYKWRYEGAD